MPTNPKPLTTLALSIAATGCPVFPSDKFKRPLTKHGYLDASAFGPMFNKFGAVFVSVATGRPSGLVAVDIDPRHSGDEWWRANEEDLPRTLTHATPSGGWHLIFVDPREADLRCSQGRVAPGVDVKANRGSCIFAGPGYWVCDISPPAEMPTWLVRACLPPPPTPMPTVPRRAPIAGDGSPYGLRALSGECDAIATAPFGRQEAILNTAAFKIARLVAADEIASDFALTELIAAGCRMAPLRHMQFQVCPT